ncbi:hypothetical protein J5N97_025971 [Dioscorea zingiberensis]|uniref:Uncharacterized protein n=1 Tax=Dioscorea zingiberensis TaxID=325984 RepID=A0A9D5H679_9LILI|nr:hypothetical protein J5N97_025971 [Dioscorea zingiberensis]
MVKGVTLKSKPLFNPSSLSLSLLLFFFFSPMPSLTLALDAAPPASPTGDPRLQPPSTPSHSCELRRRRRELLRASPVSRRLHPAVRPSSSPLFSPACSLANLPPSSCELGIEENASLIV